MVTTVSDLMIIMIYHYNFELKWVIFLHWYSLIWYKYKSENLLYISLVSLYNATNCHHFISKISALVKTYISAYFSKFISYTIYIFLFYVFYDFINIYCCWYIRPLVQKYIVLFFLNIFLFFFLFIYLFLFGVFI